MQFQEVCGNQAREEDPSRMSAIGLFHCVRLVNEGHHHVIYSLLQSVLCVF